MEAETSFNNLMQVLSVLSVWVGGIGSHSAAIVAKWLARHSDKVKLKSHVSIKVMIADGGPMEVLLEIRTTNVGNRPVTIVGVGWRAKVGKSARSAVQTFGNSLPDECPKVLHHGDTASFKIFFSDSDWKNVFATEFFFRVRQTRRSRHFVVKCTHLLGRQGMSSRASVFSSV